MSPNEPSALQLIYDELRGVRNDVRIDIAALRTDIAAISAKVAEAHKRIDGHENRVKGFIGAVGLGSGALGAAVAKYLPHLFP